MHHSTSHNLRKGTGSEPTGVAATENVTGSLYGADPILFVEAGDPGA